MDDELRQEFLEILREEPPFKRFVSRGDIPDEIDVEGPHKDVDEVVTKIIQRTLYDKLPRLQPILGSAGMGKTHYYWVLKRLEEGNGYSWRTIYVPSPPAPIRMMLHFYTCLIDDCGDWLIEEASERILSKYYEKRGIFRKESIDEVITKAVSDYPGLMADAIKALILYKMDKEKANLAKRWLFAECLNEDELDRLGLKVIIEDDDVSLATMKVLTENISKPIVFFVDEIESVYNIYGSEGEKRFLEVIKKIYNELKNVTIIVSCLSEVWERVYLSADETVRSRTEDPVHLRSFTKNDLREFIEKTMSTYWDKQNMEPPENRIFPFTDEDIDEIYTASQGNPRKAIRYTINKLVEILFGKKKKVQEVKKTDETVIKFTPSVIADSIIKALRRFGLKNRIDVALHMVEGKIESRKQKLAALISVVKNGQESIYAIDIPNVKSWNRSGGVAVYYAAKRMKNIIESGIAKKGIIPMPKGTSGNKLAVLQKELGEKLILLEFDENRLRKLIECVTNDQDCEEIDKIGEVILKDV
ncbi:MAG: hypothetical protein J7L07_04020 [Candidatus Odinarchaeota archaeon]|nr:hypothetical protein [Candidatus Odinarchaeota archaeon]